MHAGADGGGDNSGDQGGVLQYSNGYANVTSSAYTTVPHTQNWQACAAACASDASCLAWTRVAGARLLCPSVLLSPRRILLLCRFMQTAGCNLCTCNQLAQKHACMGWHMGRQLR
jgi:hypothetical protein